MLKVYDFRCDQGHIFENFVEAGVTTSRCGCGANAKRILSATSTILDGSSGDFPGAHMKWVKEHEKAGRTKREAE
jgi:predicted nucleic acid-binding Zn ribbon protein